MTPGGQRGDEEKKKQKPHNKNIKTMPDKDRKKLTYNLKVREALEMRARNCGLLTSLSVSSPLSHFLFILGH